ncbi:lysophospholipid acyltransferase LPEAT2-like [Typha angustifolia]|uniref:lysophospholipid acyltransferase LPEAT2-like n=1 Tax=Typha angustifolia TaxID=59011 RepID=UPI003C2E2030
MANNMNGDLTYPLLREADDTEVIIDIGAAGGGGINGCAGKVNGRVGREEGCENPFEFLGAPPMTEPALSPVDPFRNHTAGMGGVYEWCKIVVLLPIVALRLALFGIAIAIGYLVTRVALEGWKDKQSPMPRWRCRLMWVTRICARCILFSFGYHWIKRKGRPASRELAPVVVSNHISYIEPIFFFYELFPTIVASESHDSLPFVGTIIRAMQVIYVDRFSAASRKNAVTEIKRKASCNSFPRVLLFPEGTTTNGRFLISFQLGAFIPGYPVQPVIVRYPYVHFDQSWGNISLLKLMFKMFTQFHNFMEVEYLPIVTPLESKKDNAVNFSRRTSCAMSCALNVLQTSHSYGDLMILTRASELAKNKCTNYTVEMAWIESNFNISTSEAVELLDQFFAMNPDSNGRVGIHDFWTAFGLELSSPLCEKIFCYFDVERKGSITFRQFLIGSAHIRKQPMFMRACEAAFDKCTETCQMSITQLSDILRPTMSYMTDNSIHQLFQIFDVDDDGTISKHDFIICLRKFPHLVALFADYIVSDQSMEFV